MIIYKIQMLCDEFANYYYEGDSVRIWQLAETAPLASRWSVLSIAVWTKNGSETKDMPLPNVGSLRPYAPVFDDEAVNSLRDLMTNVELLPVDVSGTRQWLVHFMDQPECLDMSASVVVWNPISEHVSVVQTHVFNSKCADMRHLFIVPETHALELYASDKFKRAVEDAGLTGMGFKEIWRNEPG